MDQDVTLGDSSLSDSFLLTLAFFHMNINVSYSQINLNHTSFTIIPPQMFKSVQVSQILFLLVLVAHRYPLQNFIHTIQCSMKYK